MKFNEILASITGISVPIFGIQWQPPVLDSQVAADVLLFLEDKRVLYRPAHMENSAQCLSSVEDIRREMTDSLQKIQDATSPLGKKLKALRKGCREFCDVIGDHNFSKYSKVIQKSVLERELINLRSVFGKPVAEIAIAYGLDIEDDLPTIIPFNNLQ